MLPVLMFSDPHVTGINDADQVRDRWESPSPLSGQRWVSSGLASDLQPDAAAARLAKALRAAIPWVDAFAVEPGSELATFLVVSSQPPVGGRRACAWWTLGAWTTGTVDDAAPVVTSVWWHSDNGAPPAGYARTFCVAWPSGATVARLLRIPPRP